MRYPAAGELRDGHRVGTGQEEMAGVDAQLDLGLLQEARHVSEPLDGHPPVLMQRRHQPPASRDFHHPLHVRLEQPPLFFGHLDGDVVAGVMGVGSQDEHLRPARRQGVRRPFHVVELGCGEFGPVEHRGHEATRQCQPVGVQQASEFGGISGKEPVRSQFGRLEADGGHLAEDAIVGQEVTPARRPIHSPSDGRPGHPRQQITHRRGSPRLPAPGGREGGNLRRAAAPWGLPPSSAPFRGVACAERDCGTFQNCTVKGPCAAVKRCPAGVPGAGRRAGWWDRDRQPLRAPAINPRMK